MFTAEQFRAKAAECAETLKNSVVPSEIREFQRARQSFSLLAQNKDWLAENFDKLIRVQDMLPQDDIVERNVDRRAVAETKEHILQCLEADLIMKWNTIPTALQQELFDPDGSPATCPKRPRCEGRLSVSCTIARTTKTDQLTKHTRIKFYERDVLWLTSSISAKSSTSCRRGFEQRRDS